MAFVYIELIQIVTVIIEPVTIMLVLESYCNPFFSVFKTSIPLEKCHTSLFIHHNISLLLIRCPSVNRVLECFLRFQTFLLFYYMPSSVVIRIVSNEYSIIVIAIQTWNQNKPNATPNKILYYVCMPFFN